MGKRLHVGNLEYSVTDADLTRLFSQHGAVDSAEVVQNKARGRSMGFGFVEMATEEGARAAIAALHGRPVGDRRVTVEAAKPKKDGPA